jgi:GTP-binding protein
MPLFQNLTFIQSAQELTDLPPHAGLEIAFAGRSNAGKSSAINALANHNRLAFVSKTPGRTQLINFFRMATGDYLVDLPGYGYAKVPHTVRAHWQGLLEFYLTTRDQLCGLALMMDVRRPLTDLDVLMLNWFIPTGKPVHVLLTKSDKLTPNQGRQTLREVQTALAKSSPLFSAQLFSSTKKTGIDEAEAVLAGWLPNVSMTTPEQKREVREEIRAATTKTRPRAYKGGTSGA